MKTNTAKPKTPAPKTHEGAVAARINPEQQLRRVVLACMLFEDQYYIDGKESAVVIDEAVAAVLTKKNGPEIVSKLAIETRTSGKLRHAPLYLALSLVRAGNKDTEKGKACRAVVADTLYEIIQRPDELAEFLSLYYGKKKTPISMQVKKGLARAFGKFNRYSLSKYANRDGAISLRDVLFLCHPKPSGEEQAQLWKELANKQLTAPENTWEVILSSNQYSKKEAWEKVIDEWIVTKEKNSLE